MCCKCWYITEPCHTCKGQAGGRCGGCNCGGEVAVDDNRSRTSTQWWRSLCANAAVPHQWLNQPVRNEVRTDLPQSTRAALLCKQHKHHGQVQQQGRHSCSDRSKVEQSWHQHNDVFRGLLGKCGKVVPSSLTEPLPTAGHSLGCGALTHKRTSQTLSRSLQACPTHGWQCWGWSPELVQLNLQQQLAHCRMMSHTCGLLPSTAHCILLPGSLTSLR